MSESQKQLLLCWDYNLSIRDAHLGATAAKGRAASTLADMGDVVVRFLLCLTVLGIEPSNDLSSCKSYIH